MKFLSLTSVATLALAATGVVNSLPYADPSPQSLPQCENIITRKELLSLSPDEWKMISTVVNSMKDKGWINWFAYLHTELFQVIHNCEMFFPFHRAFVKEFENIGRRFEPNFFQPYWDEMRDYRNPPASEVLSAQWIGGNGQPDTHCVTDGALANWNLTFPKTHCLQRNYTNNGKMGTWYSPEYINSIVQLSPNMSTFRPNIEYTIHGIVHIDVGGDMDSEPSPNDWIFMLHHANIDRLWSLWQADGHTWTMDGKIHDGQPCTLDTIMPHYNTTISTVMELGYGKMCYKYQAPTINSTNTNSSGVSSEIINNPIIRTITHTDQAIDVVTPTTMISGGAFMAVAQPVRKRNEQTRNAISMKDITPSSSKDTSALSRENLISSLPKGMLSKYFPQYVNDTVRSPHAAVGRTDEEDESYQPIPQPNRFPDRWLKMHGISNSNYNLVFENAQQFVRDLNKAGYKSPY